MSQPPPESLLPAPAPAPAPAQVSTDEGEVPGPARVSDDEVPSEEWTGTAVFPALSAPAVAGPTEPRRCNRLVIALSVAVFLLLATAGVLTALVIEARSDADRLAASEAAEDREQQEALQAVQDQRAPLEQRIEDAEADAATAESRIAAAEAAQRAAEEATAAREQADAEAAAADEQTFVDALHATETMTGVPDAELLERGRDVCTYLDSTPGTPADLSDAFDRASETYAIDDAILLVTAATQILCPEYSG